MPMPRTNVQSLGAHVSNMAGSARGYVFGSNSRNSKQNGIKAEAILDDEDTSSSDSDSDMSDGEGTENFLSKINAATAGKKAAAADAVVAANKTPKFEPAATLSKSNAKAAGKATVIPSSQAKKIKPEPKDASSSSDSSSSEEDSEDEKPVTKPVVVVANKTASKPEPKKVDVSSSSESSSDSNSESSDEDDAGVKVVAPESKKQPAAPSKAKDDSSSSEETEDSSEEEEEEAQASKQSKITVAKPKQAAKPAVTVTKKAVEGSSSESASESDDSSSEEDESSDEEPPAKPTKTVAVKKVVKGAATAKSKPIVEDSDEEMADESFALVKKSQPPNDELADEFVREGFQLRKAPDDADASTVLDLFKTAKRDGKQIWYFTTPASVPISVVETMNFPMRNAQTGEAIVSHNGVDYGVDLGASGMPSAFKILVPAKKGSKYEMVDRDIDHTMHLNRITQLAASDFTAKPKAQISAPKPPRPQPAVLKKRYTPIGVPTPVLPPLPPILKQREATNAPEEDALASDKKSKKRKAGTEEINQTPGSEKKSKKAKTVNSVTADPPIPASTPPTPAAARLKSQAKGKATAVATPSPHASKSKSSAAAARSQTPIPLPKIPRMNK